MQLIRDTATSTTMMQRARVIALSGEGMGAREVASQLGFTVLTVYKWRRRYRINGLAGLLDLARPGQPKKLSVERRERIVMLTRFTTPDDAPHWSIRRMARLGRVTEHQVRRIWLEEQLSAVSRSGARRAELAESSQELVGVCVAPQLSVAVFEASESGARSKESAAASSPLHARRSEQKFRRQDGIYSAFAGSVLREPDANVAREIQPFLNRVTLAARPEQTLLVSLVESTVLDQRRVIEHFRPRALQIDTPATLGQWLFALEQRCAALEQRRDSTDARNGSLDFRRALRAFIAGRRASKSSSLFSWTRPVWQALLLAVFVFTWPRDGHAYAWMIRHGYSQCAQCHVDPSGSGALTEYGRAMGEILLRTHYDEDSASPADDDDSAGKFLFGAIELPRGLELGGDLRVLSLHSKVEHVELSHQLIWMQADAHAAVSVGPFVASGTLGYAPRGALGATLTHGALDNWVSREHWLGFWTDDDHTALLRAGRMNVPFGVRSIEHTLWARAYTRSDTNDAQQYGLALTYVKPAFRAELMGIFGNFELRPDVFRERGYSAYAEYFALPKLGLGASSRITHVALDTQLLREEWRHAHGVFARWATDWDPLVLLSEWDYVFESPKYQLRRTGIVGFLQADLEATQGVHFVGTLEAANVSTNPTPFSWGAWLSYAWFFAPHADIRLDNVYQSFASSSGRTTALSFLIQGHVYL